MERGRVYGRFTARYGEGVEVRGSSAACEPQCWLGVESAKNKNDGTGGEREEVSALLNVSQARVLRSALDSFIGDAEND